MDGTTIRTIRIAYDFKIIPFDDALWKLAFRDLRDKFNIEPITILETKKFTTPFMRYFDVYVDKALIEERGYGAVVEAVKEKIDNKMQKEMDVFFKDFFLKRRITMEKLEKLKKEREELDKRIETLEYAERMFEEGDGICHVDEFGNVNCGKWGNFAWIDGAFSQGHIFKTKQEAELEAKRRNLLTRFRAFRDECNDGWKPDWRNHRDRKYFISFAEGVKLVIFNTGTVNQFCLFDYFKDDKDAQRAIELFGDEIKALFVDLEEN